MKITGDDINAFFKAKSTSDKCLYCSNDNWTLFSADLPPEIQAADPNGDVVVKAEHDDDLAPMTINPTLYAVPFKQSDRAMQAMPMVCSNCGFVRLQDFRTFMLWKIEHDKGVEASEKS